MEEYYDEDVDDDAMNEDDDNNDVENVSDDDGSDDNSNSHSQLKKQKLSQQPEQEQEQVEHQVSRKQMKMKIKLLNKELSELAQRKQLKTGLKKFHAALNKGYEPDAHTYANLLNLYVRCGDVAGAMNMFHTHIEATHPQADTQTITQSTETLIPPNIVIYTTLLKGLCESGDMNGAKAMFYDRILANVSARRLEMNVRVLNTYLRGCVRNGKCAFGVEAFAHFDTNSKQTQQSQQREQADKHHNKNKKKRPHEQTNTNKKSSSSSSSLTFDTTTYEYMALLLTQSMQADSANSLLSACIQTTTQTNTQTDNNVIENAYQYYYLARMYAHMGDRAQCLQWCAVCECALEASKHTHVKQSILSKLSQQPEEHTNTQHMKNADKHASKHGNKHGNKHTNKGGNKSIDLFLQHRRLELEQLLQDLKEFVHMFRCEPTSLLHFIQRTNTQGQTLKKIESLQQYLLAQDNNSSGSNDVSFLLSQRARYVDMLSRLFWFDNSCVYTQDDSSSASKGEDDVSALAHSLIQSLNSEYGLDNVCAYTHQQSTSTHIEKGIIALLTLCKRNAMGNIVQSIDADTCCIDFNKVFDASTHTSTHTNTKEGCLPIKMEIASGSGEWVVQQALADRDPASGHALANWVALELRCVCVCVCAHECI
jgi:pentatricopeptide repeat protein